ncbi:MAG: SurA N-terminal domain-containing protein [Spirosomataceae bacterium]
MAVITKIREKAGIAVGVVAVALLLFIVGGDMFGSQGIFSSNQQKVGEIAGHDIMYQDFQQKIDQARQSFEAQSGRSATEEDLAQIREQAWNQFLLDYAYQKEFDALGLSVSSDELVDMVQGNNIHPSVMQAFTNPQTRQFDKNQLISYLKNLKTLPPAQQQAWQTFEKSLAEQRVQEKYENLLRLSAYATTDEAKKEYQAQTAKANIRYLYVPFYSIVDSTVKVTDSQLQDYLEKHKDQYKGQSTRTFQYVAFPVIPSKADSLDLYNKIKDLAKGLATAANDSAFARMNTDVPNRSVYMSLRDMSDQLKAAVKTFNPGGVYGPYREGNTYSIYKYGGTKQDTLYTVRASHILIMPSNQSDTAKAAARVKAESVLARIKGGANFEALAATEGMDGTAQKGGDLGYFQNNNTMVKKFQDAIFGFNGTGLMPNLVETDFGFHIVKVTEAKSNTLYRLAAITKELAPSEGTRDEAFRKADQFALENKTMDAFKAAAKKQNLISLTANRISEDAATINGMKNAREVIRWAFNKDTELNEVSSAFELDNVYIVAIETGKSDKDKVTIEDYRDELTAKVRAELKAEQIKQKLTGASGTLEQIAQKYGAGALVETVNDLSMNGGVLTSAGADPSALGKAFGLKPGQKSKPFVGEGGVFIMELISKTDAPAIADYTQYKNSARQAQMQRTSLYINEAIKENAKVVDNRAKFF